LQANWILSYLWLIPALPLLAAALSALAPRTRRMFAASLAVGSMALALLLSCIAFGEALRHAGQGEEARQVFNFPWFQIGEEWLRLGWMLDPLTAVMLVMVSFVGLLIFIFSIGYMSHDENFTRFFCFLSLFAAAMLGVVIANSLLLFFMCWELVGLTSYLLIGFWFHKPSAAAAAKKAFITTRVGDLAFLLGMVWLFSRTGTLLFYDSGSGCLEAGQVTRLATEVTTLGLTVSTGIGLLIFCGAIGKSGQVPLHVWLPDAMEGPTPVSALIHAATMVAAGVFLVARVYPLMGAHVGTAPEETIALQAVTWVGAITAVFAATIALAQTDIKRILAYSTVSQLGFMMLGLGVGGVAVGMFHLITHAFFKALLFLGAGSVIHGCHEEQDIRKMGGLKKFMPVTFATYAIGMLALSGFPLVFSGFWSKDEILHSAHDWSISRVPFYLGAFGALLTAFYMTRQVLFVFFGAYRGSHAETPVNGHEQSPSHAQDPHESPGVMTWPLILLAACAILLGFLGTPAWPWFQGFLEGKSASVNLAKLFEGATPGLMALSSIIVLLGIGLGYWVYGRKPLGGPDEVDAFERARPDIFSVLKNKYYFDEVYEWLVVRFNAWWARFCAALDVFIWNGMVQLLSFAVQGLSAVSRLIDEGLVNEGFDQGCRRVTAGGKLMSRLQDGRLQNYLRVIGVAMTVLVLILIWGCHAS
jgi:NADH-quinone oxidoreductase subunit L